MIEDHLSTHLNGLAKLADPDVVMISSPDISQMVEISMKKKQKLTCWLGYMKMREHVPLSLKKRAKIRPRAEII